MVELAIKTLRLGEGGGRKWYYIMLSSAQVAGYMWCVDHWGCSRGRRFRDEGSFLGRGRIDFHLLQLCQ